MAGFTFHDAAAGARAGQDIDSLAKNLYSQLTPDERLHLLDGDDQFWPGFHNMLTDGYNRRPIIHGCVERLGIPGVRFADGPRGCVVGESTAFPVPMARGASWDLDLEERIGIAIGREGPAQGANFFGGVCVNLPRHPAWGRIQETYGEDPIILGEFGAALTRGVQRNMMACVKHYALNSMENARFQVDVHIELDVLHEVFLAHFRRIIEENVAAVMSSYNSVRSEWAGQNKELLLDILRDQWGFKGFVMSDFLFGLRDGPLSVKNGLDIEAPFTNMRGRTCKDALKNGSLSESDVERAGLCILRKEIEDESRREAPGPQPSVVFCDEHRALAREAASKAMVLLKNEKVDNTPLLPLSKDTKKIAVIGRLANSKDTGDRGSSAVRPPHVVSPYEGLKLGLPESEISLDDSTDVASSKATAGAADAAVVVVGYDWRDEGEFTIPPFKTNPKLKDILPPLDGSEEAEYTQNLLLTETLPEDDIADGDDNYGLGAGGDRTSLRLAPRDIEIIKAVAEANPKTVVVIVAAGAVIMSEWDNLPPAILYSWYSGCEGGHALADVLMGRVNFAGRLPFSIPTDEKHLPFFDKDAKEISYDRWFGQHLLDKTATDAAYPLGYGQSYTAFSLSDLIVRKASNPEKLEVEVSVKNTGPVAGRYIAQVYGAANVPERPRRVLLGFGLVDLQAGEESKVRIEASTRPLRKWDNGNWPLWTRHVEIEVGGHSGSEESIKTRLQL